MSANLPPVRTCDRISEQIHLLADKELGPAEQSVVEQHLHECPRCQIVAVRLERMSSVLKAWDAECNDHDAPALRLHNAVLARVAEHGAVRRRETRLDTFVQFATAACVLVALGLAVVFGLQGPDEAAAVLDAGANPPADARSPLASDTPLDGLRVADVIPEARVAEWIASLELNRRMPMKEAPLPSGEPWKLQVLTRDGSAGRLALVVERMRRVAELREALGTDVMACYMPSLNGQLPRTMPVHTYKFLYEREYIRGWNQSLLSRGSRTVEKSSSDDRGPVALETGRVAREMLAPMPGLEGEKLDPLFVRPPVRVAVKAPTRAAGSDAGKGDVIEALAIRVPRAPARLESTPLDPNAGRGRFLDPVVAQSQASKLLTLRPGRDAGSVVALVKGTALPIFIPAGQIITGGVADRVVAQPMWLPPSKGETPHVIPCRVVERYPDGNADEEPMIQPWIAGPTIRALLAAGASQAEVKEAARLQVEAVFGRNDRTMSGDDWSLRRLYVDKYARANMERLSSAYRVRSEDRGFVAIDGSGRLLGIEIVRLGGPAAEALIHRLWFSYVLEMQMRVRGTSPDAVAAPGEGVAEALRRIAAHERSFSMPQGFTQAEPHLARVSAVEVAVAGLHIHALETAGKPTVVSGLSSPTK